MFCLSNWAFAQSKQIVLKFVPYYNNEPLVLENNWYTTPNGQDSITIDLLKFYIGNIKFQSTTQKTKNSYFLLNAAENKSMETSITVSKKQKTTTLEFNVGVDSSTSAKGVLDGSLNPLNGMYWTWNTGYINLKLEGNCKNCKAFRNKYLFHIGGFKFPFNSCKKIVLPLDGFNKNTSKIVIKINIANWLKNIDFTEQVSIMQPNAKAMQMANNFINSFSILNYQ
jgi:hypothetical protein